MAKRKGFNFYASYYTVMETLNDKEKLQYLMALIEREFDGKHPDFLKMLPMAKFAYISQQHSIDAQVIGFEQKTKELLTPIGVSTQGGYKGGSVQEKEKEEGKEKVQLSIVDLAFNDFLEMRRKIKKPATERAVELLKQKLDKLAPNNDELKVEIINQSIVKGWQDFFEIKNGFIAQNKQEEKQPTLPMYKIL